MSRTLTPTQRADAKALRGKTIARIILRPFDPGSNHIGTATDPILVFTDGTRLAFAVQETEVGEYGVELIYSDASIRAHASKKRRQSRALEKAARRTAKVTP